MSVFFDTNILIYRVDFREPEKRARAKQLFDTAMFDRQALLSTQSLQEFYNAATRKLGMPASMAKALTEHYAQANIVQVSPSLIFSAMDRHAGGQFSFWDALIVEAARTSGATTLYTEDMQDGLVIDGLTLCNPFAGL